MAGEKEIHLGEPPSDEDREDKAAIVAKTTNLGASVYMNYGV